MDALVTEAHIRWSVAGIRALGRAGLQVAALAPRRSAAGNWSRYVRAREHGPDVLADGDGYVETVAAVGRRHGPLVVYPGYERGIDALLEARLPPEVILPYPPAEVVQRLRDKRALADLAASAGLVAPRTLAVGPAAELAARRLPAPYVIKAARRGGSLNETLVAAQGADVGTLLADLPDDEPLLAQELVEGPLTSLALVLARDGTPVARFQQVAVRTWPARAGGSALARSVPPDELLVQRSAQLLAATGFWGLAQLQFMSGPAGPALIDVNTRFYGSLPLALGAGVNLPAAWHAVTLGQSVPPPGAYRVGVAYRWLEAEVAAAFRGAWRGVARRPPKPRSGAMWAPDDPLPSLVLTTEAAAARIIKRLPVSRG
jgi:predicted ATP-grasp superfamily ATP-dependent carboligase